MASTSICKFLAFLLFALTLTWGLQSCHGFRTFGYDIHHRFLDSVKGILSVEELPEMGSLEYYAAMAHRDRIIRGRGLASDDAHMLTFANGNSTIHLNTLGFLHYANVSLGIPSVTFLVALDTGSDLFWVPCNCISCLNASLVAPSGDKIDLNIYSLNASSTSKKVPCDSSLCEHRRECSGRPSSCPYQAFYLSNGTSSSGILVEDVLHMTTDSNHPEFVDARITFGCGQVQTGSFLGNGAPNGLFGLGMDKLSVPSILSSAGLTANSFSMCFGPDGIGRMRFGDKGSPNQGETPFYLNHLHPTYNITVIQISVGNNLFDINFSAIFDLGTAFTYLNDPAYSHLSESFNAQALDNRRPSYPGIPFEYCYDLSFNVTGAMVPSMNLTMKGGSQFPVYDPILFISDKTASSYCLGVVKSPDVNIIGQNFMTGYHIVFDREKLVLGWKESNCYDIEEPSTLPINPRNSTTVPPANAVEPATKDVGNGFPFSGPSPSVGWSPRLNSFSPTFFMLCFLFLAMV